MESDPEKQETSVFRCERCGEEIPIPDECGHCGEKLSPPATAGPFPRFSFALNVVFLVLLAVLLLDRIGWVNLPGFGESPPPASRGDQEKNPVSSSEDEARKQHPASAVEPVSTKPPANPVSKQIPSRSEGLSTPVVHAHLPKDGTQLLKPPPSGRNQKADPLQTNRSESKKKPNNTKKIPGKIPVETKPKPVQKPAKTLRPRFPKPENVKQALTAGEISTSSNTAHRPVVFNDPVDQSVYQVVDWLKRYMAVPESFRPLEWGQVLPLDGGNFAVRLKFTGKTPQGERRAENRFFFLDAAGTVLGYPISTSALNPAVLEAGKPRRTIANHPADRSVPEVVLWLRRHMKNPESFTALYWGDVSRLHTGNYVVRCRWRGAAADGRQKTRDDLFFIDVTGTVLGKPKPMDVRPNSIFGWKTADLRHLE